MDGQTDRLDSLEHLDGVAFNAAMCFAERRENLAGLRLWLATPDVCKHITERFHTNTNITVHSSKRQHKRR